MTNNTLLAGLATLALMSGLSGAKEKMNVLFIISDDLTATAVSCYENKACKTPNIDKLASEGVRFTRTFCQFPVCGPSRASLMNGYYPHATKVFGYVSGRKAIGPDRATWAEHFKNNGYHTARVSKIFHMGVPGGIEAGTHGADDPASWVERYNSQGPEVFSKGRSELLEGNPKGTKKVRGGNTLEYCMADEDDLVQSDGKTAKKASELIRELGKKDKPFFLAVGFVRPHVPFVAPSKYFEPYDYRQVELPESVENDWDDIPKAGINYRTTPGMKMNETQIKKGIATYYASVSFMDAQVGKVIKTLKDEGLKDNTIIIFTSDHGFHLNEHDFWMKVGLMDESSRVPMIIKVPGKKPAVCDSFTELIDLYPTITELCGLEVPKRIQGKDLGPMLDDPTKTVRDGAFCVNGGSLLWRTDKWAFIMHGANGQKGMQLFDMKKDPKQFTNLAHNPEYRKVVEDMKSAMADKLKEVRTNDLKINYNRMPGKER